MSIPTSLIIVVLVAAWLAVLVPMVARRRESVPEAEADSGTFRVLRRASASIRRRPRVGRLNDAGYDDEHASDELLTDEQLDEEQLDHPGKLSADEFADTRHDVQDVHGEQGRDESFAPRADSYAADGHVEETIDEQHDEYAPASSPRSQDRRPHRREPLQGVDQANLRPVPRRPGRGGYDPDAAELARAYRYSRRRRVTVILLLATVAFSLAAFLFRPVLWTGTAVFSLLLVAYLGYLHRQVRIESDIQQRRLDRLRRARQIRPEYSADQQQESVTGSGYARSDLASQVPPSGYRRGREIVDLEDDDPSFDDLEYYQPIQYRQASGQ